MPRSPPDTLTVAVVGATGAVGRTMIQVLTREGSSRITELRLLASERSAGPDRDRGRHATHTVGLATPGGVRGRRHRAVLAPAAGRRRSSRRRPRSAAASSSTTRAPGGWTRSVPLVVEPGQPRRPRVARGHHREPQLLDDAAGAAADGAARRGRHRAGRRRHLPGVAGHRPQGDRRARGAGQGARRGPPQGRRASTRTRSRSTPCPHIDVFLDNGYTKEEWKVVTESRKILHLPDLRVSCTAVRVPVFIGHSEAVHVETRDPITPGRGARRCSPASRASSSRTTRRRTSTRWRPRPPARTRSTSGRVRQDLSIAGNRGPRVLGRVATTCARARRPTRSRSPSCSSSAAGSARASERQAAWRRPGDGPRDPRRAPAALEEIANEVRACTRCRLHEGRTQRRARARATRTPRSCSSARARASTRTARAGRSSGAPAACWSGCSASIGWQRDDVFITNVVKCRPPDNRDPAAGRDRRLRAVPAPPARGARPGRRRDAGPVLDGRRSCPAPGSARSTARPHPVDPGTGAARRARVRDVPPRRGAADRRRSSARASRTSPGSRPCCIRARERREGIDRRRARDSRAGRATADASRDPRVRHRPSPPRPQPRPAAQPTPAAVARRARARRRLPAHPVLTPDDHRHPMA